MNKNSKTKLVLASLFFVFAAASALALQGSNTNYDLIGVTGSTGSQGSNTNYDAGTTLGNVPSGHGSSASYDVCVGYWCGKEAAPPQPCNPPANGNWIIPAFTTVVCKDMTIDMPSNANLLIKGTLVFNNVVFNMNANTNGSANITVEAGGVFTTVDVGDANQPNPGSIIKSGNGQAYLFQVLGGAVDIENSEISDAGCKLSGGDLSTYGIYLNGATEATFLNNIIKNTIFGLFLNDTNETLIQRNRIEVKNNAGAISYSLYIKNSQKNNVVENTLIYPQSAAAGVYASSAAADNKFTSNKFQSTGNILYDFLGKDTATNSIILDSPLTGKNRIITSDSSNATREWYHDVRVVNKQGKPLGGATVIITPNKLQNPGPTFGGDAGGIPPFHGSVVTHQTNGLGLTPKDEAIQYDQNIDGDNQGDYNPYNVTAYVERSKPGPTPIMEKIYGYAPLFTLDKTQTTEVVIDADPDYFCHIEKVVPQTIYYPPNGRNALTATFDNAIQPGQRGTYTCGVTDSQTPFIVPPNRVLEFNCPEGTGNYPDGQADYAAVVTVEYGVGQFPAYCTNTTFVRPQSGGGVTLTANVSSGSSPLDVKLTATFPNPQPGWIAVFNCTDSGNSPEVEKPLTAGGTAQIDCTYWVPSGQSSKQFKPYVYLKTNRALYAETTITVQQSVNQRVTLNANPNPIKAPRVGGKLTGSSTLLAQFFGSGLVPGQAKFYCDTSKPDFVLVDINPMLGTASTVCSYETTLESAQFTAKVEHATVAGVSTQTIVYLQEETTRQPYPSDVSFLSAGCPTSLVLGNETNVTGYLVVQGETTCLPNAADWTVTLTAPKAQPTVLPIAPYPNCVDGYNKFHLDTVSEGTYKVDLIAHTTSMIRPGVGDLASSCSFNVLPNPPSRFPDVHLLVVLLAALAVFAFLSRYSKKQSKQKK